MDGKERWLYPVRDCVRVAKEERDYLSRPVSGFSDSELKAKQERLGTVVLESNLNRTTGGNLSGIFEEMGDRDGDEILQAVLRIQRDEGA